MFLLGDFIARIKNGVLAKKDNILVKKSKFILEIINILYKEGYINGYSFFNQYYLKVYLKYFEGYNVINNIFLISKPGRRIYKKYKDIFYFSKRGIFLIISTSDGLITNKELYVKKKKNKKYNERTLLKKNYNFGYIYINKDNLYNFVLKNNIIKNKDHVIYNNNNIYKLNIVKHLNRFFIEFKKYYIYNIYIWLIFFRKFCFRLSIIKEEEEEKGKIKIELKEKRNKNILQKTKIIYKKNILFFNKIFWFIIKELLRKKYKVYSFYKFESNAFLLKKYLLQKYRGNFDYNKVISLKYYINYLIDLYKFTNICENKNLYYKLINIYKRKFSKQTYKKGGEVLLGII